MLDQFGLDAVLVQEEFKDLVFPEAQEGLVGEVDGDAMEDAIGCERPVGDQAVQVGMEVEERAEGLDGQDAAGKGVGAKQGTIDFGDRLPCQRWQLVEQVAVEAEEDAEAFGDGPDELAMGHGQADILGDVQAEKEGAFLGAAWADAALLAGEGDEELVVAVRAADAGEAVLEVAALEEGGDGLVDGGPPEAELLGVTVGVGGAEVMEMLADQAVEVGFKRLARAVDGGGWAEEADHGWPRGRGRNASVRKGLC